MLSNNKIFKITLCILIFLITSTLGVAIKKDTKLIEEYDNTMIELGKLSEEVQIIKHKVSLKKDEKASLTEELTTLESKLNSLKKDIEKISE